MNKNWLKQWWVEYLLLALIMALAASLRFYKLGAWSYWVDELYTFENGLRNYSDILHRPFWIITKFALDVFGTNSFALRLFPCIFGILTIPLLYFPIRRIFSSRVALLAITFLAVSPWHIYLSQLARWYSLLLLASTFSLLAFYFAIERNSVKLLSAAVLLFAFAFSLHMTAGFVLIIALGYLFMLSRISKFQPEGFSAKKVNWFFIALVLVGLLFIPKFIAFVEKWESIKLAMGYWGSTPINFTMKVLYHLTPAMGVMSFAGLVLLVVQKERKGLFFLIYCLLPLLTLNLAAALETNVSAKYVFFILPGLCIAAGYLCNYIFEKISGGQLFAGAVIFAATILPSLQTDFTYFTTGYGNRDRMREAAELIRDQFQEDDRIFLLYVFENPEEAKFFFKTIAELSDFHPKDEQFIWPETPAEIDLNKRIWVVNTGNTIPPDATGFYKWVADNASLITEFNAYRGPLDNSVKIYLHRALGEYASTTVAEKK